MVNVTPYEKNAKKGAKMAKIELLDQNTINKIAAGEVVERPAAVVKELIENAIDAGANAVTCEIKDGGLSMIRITDNGSGIAKEEIKVAFLRHATSKIRSVEDLLYVSSLGFRGEALASIASVAQVELLTKTASDMTGVRYVIEGGTEKSMEEIGCPNGTTFLVRNLFFNTPARRKFLKSATTEASYISELMTRLAVSHPDVSFKFITNNQIKMHTSGNNNVKDILYHIYGREIASNLLEVNAQIESVKVYGYIGKPLVSRGNRTYENYFINGRYIRSGVICKAIEEAYKPFVMSHKYPFTALHFEIDSGLIDVNVHPTKLEVRFRNSDLIYKMTQEAIKEALSTKEMIPEIKLVKEEQEQTKISQAPEPFEVHRRQKEGYKEGNPYRLERQEKKTSNALSGLDTPKELIGTEIGKLNHVVNHAYELGAQRLVEPKKEQEELQERDQQNADSMEKPSIFEQLRLKKQALFEEQNKSKEAVEATVVHGEIKEHNYSEQGNVLDSVLVREDNTFRVDNNSEKENSVTIGNKDDLRSNPNTDCSEENVRIGSQLDLFQEQTTQDNGDESKFLSAQARKNHHIIGQVFATYWIVEHEDKMFLIDQHAAHEKVLFEKTMKMVHDKQQMSQMISPPIIISLSMREEEALLKHKTIFEQLGYEIEPFGGKEYSIRAVPSDMLSIADEALLVELIDQLVEEANERDTQAVLEKVASMSCKAAIKGNQKISLEEANDLMDQLLELDNPYHCPHGRPVIVSMSKYELEKKFKRII